MNRILYVLGALLFLVVHSHAAAVKPLNIVVLYADDWRHDTLGVAGNPVVKTPNLDRLAAERALHSQLRDDLHLRGEPRQPTHRAVDVAAWLPGIYRIQDKTPWEETYPGLLRAHAYHVGHVGKWHNGKFPAERFDTPEKHQKANEPL